jgi:RNA polymerase sigma-70 factor (ECF subfamily)
MPSTEDLVNAVREGEKSAFAELARLYERAAIITAHHVLRDYHRAQDATQEGFLIAYKELNQLSTAARFGPWLLKIVHRCALRMQRDRRAGELVSDVAESDRGRASDWMQRHQDVVEKLGRLPDHERVVVVLRYIEGRSPQAIAESLGKPVETIKKQLARGLQRLRRLCKQVSP